ncbi:Adenine-specific DNA methylase, contains a Zn-ribbon domain [Devosia lucknowensis]|uniref:Adenine-specific DNA methylase, contains a Zn-ribbon domain n=1 Tax=Devosia lucknowensis TaxID=1096929 RepID=A0A1Y6G729_9HYPH|nr:anti-phage-associated DUF1156 domain-containing protein [Devosia lucknowensis]SMQ85916.1 Adenine-specific DNA methylase, contains a Zn-ribbon domain [Devosia lucknowensis]
MLKTATEITPFSLANAPYLIERIFPSMKISAEAQKERKAGSGQTLTALGSYWKGRKPLVLVRACLLGGLLPATSNLERDLEVFEMLMALDDQGLATRSHKKSSPGTEFPYEERIKDLRRPEHLGDFLTNEQWQLINGHLGTSAASLSDLINQLGIMRFGRTPVVSDVFSGGGSIPFEASRIGFDAVAADLNPVACMLTWGAMEIVGTNVTEAAAIRQRQEAYAQAFNDEVLKLGLDTDASGNRAKAYLFCLETTCPATGWNVPLLPSTVISEGSRTVAVLVPDEKSKTYRIRIHQAADADEFRTLSTGTVKGGRIVHPMNEDVHGVSVSSIRGETSTSNTNSLRPWTKEDVAPRPQDIFRERLYAIQWQRPDGGIFFKEVTDEDVARESWIEGYVAANLADWQQDGLVSDMAIETGKENEGPIRTNGWTYWHHMFTPRQIVYHKILASIAPSDPVMSLIRAKALDYCNKSSQWRPRGDYPEQLFSGPSLKTMFNWGVRASKPLMETVLTTFFCSPRAGSYKLLTQPAGAMNWSSDLVVTDPPYSDSVVYDEITEFFIAWLRNSHAPQFDNFTWDSRRRLAVKGQGEHFRAGMVSSYRATTEHMSDNGLQIVMFTHKDSKVWSDMAQIFWGAGLQVIADWYIATETTSEIKKGGYIQGTHIIILRKRDGSESGYSDEVTQEVKDEVARQIEDMVGLNQSLRGHGRSENLFNDADLQMAGYAAALRVLTKYVKIDGKDMTVEALRPRANNERTLIDDIIEYAVQVANEHLVPEGMSEQTWRKLTGTERFYLKMMDIETTGSKKVDNYQNFAKAFRVSDYGDLMSSVTANGAALKTAVDFGKRQMGDDEFGSSLTRAVLYALWEMKGGVSDEDVVSHLRDLTTDYLDQRADLQAIATYIASKRKQIDVTESQNATILAGLIKNERLG